MNNEIAMHAELVSALVDGELAVDEFAAVVESVTSTREGMVTWQAYHLVGDVLRGAVDPAALGGDDFVARLRSRMAAQDVQAPRPGALGSAIAMEPAKVAQQGANDPVIRWKLLAGFASLAAVATFGWHLASLGTGSGTLAHAPSVPQTQAGAAGAAPNGEHQANLAGAPPVMLRDARLDELLAAHKQFGGTSALQMPAGFLRNATFDGSDR
jgi:sigma-E factor negative regulatory protein RseA